MEILINDIHASYKVIGEKACLLCPPHPLMGGSRFDIRLERISEALNNIKFSTLSFDYKKPFRGGIGEIEDAKMCFEFLKSRHDFIAILGYSFGSVVASNVATEMGDALILISPLKKIDEIELKDCKLPKLIVVAEKDQIISIRESEEVIKMLSEPKKVVRLETDHFYTGKFDELNENIVNFLSSIH